jgi:hypothetical protein
MEKILYPSYKTYKILKKLKIYYKQRERTHNIEKVSMVTEKQVPDPVIHFSYPNYSRGGNWEDHSSRSGWAKISELPSQ